MSGKLHRWSVHSLYRHITPDWWMNCVWFLSSAHAANVMDRANSLCAEWWILPITIKSSYCLGSFFPREFGFFSVYVWCTLQNVQTRKNAFNLLQHVLCCFMRSGVCLGAFHYLPTAVSVWNLIILSHWISRQVLVWIAPAGKHADKLVLIYVFTCVHGCSWILNKA